MTAGTLVIPIAFILVTTGLLWFVIYAKGWWWVKAIYMIIVLIFAIAIWQNIESYRGWPTEEETPLKSIFLWGSIQEPESETGFKGAIYLWLINYNQQIENNILGYHAEKREPRAYKLAYSRLLHENIQKAEAMVKKGKVVIMEKNTANDESESDEIGNKGKKSLKNGLEGRLKGNKGGGHKAKPYDELFFYEMPPAALPEKS
ncbi:MAG: hypothetical protein AAB847_01385 [Patescibacteria group bacterium]